ncbi:MAG: 6-phospho-3-hexuloisomerase [Flavobacteriaceae bacterium]|nr:6-phospho-3-hexuloisomerase [Flavobacteriaceae bacterium]
MYHKSAKYHHDHHGFGQIMPHIYQIVYKPHLYSLLILPIQMELEKTKGIYNMAQLEVSQATEHIEEALRMILGEHQQVTNHLSYNGLSELIEAIDKATHIFMIGAGRSGFMIKAAAMRLMHLGYSVFVVGETIAPAILEGDLLIGASGSGTTGSIVKAAETAHKNNAEVACFTTDPNSRLSQISNYTVTIPAAGKQELNETVSQQYAGSLFEQSFLLLFYAIVQHLWQTSGASRDELWKRHANME